MKLKTLTIILCQTREAEFNFSSLVEKLLIPMNSDLAFCGSANTKNYDEILINSRFVWNREEPTDWIEALNEISRIDNEWECLLSVGDMFFGGTGLGQTVGSGAIIFFWREVLNRHITTEILEEYEWFIITRSDFLWLSPHPNVKDLNPREVYFLDGEQHGGLSDRHIIFHRSNAEKIFSLASPLFNESAKVKQSLLELETDLNPEIYIKFAIEQMGLFQNIRLIPYLGFTTRHGETQTRWSSGNFSKKLGFFVKYPSEYESAKLVGFLFRRSENWEKFISGKFSIRISILKFFFFFRQINVRVTGVFETLRFVTQRMFERK